MCGISKRSPHSAVFSLDIINICSDLKRFIYIHPFYTHSIAQFRVPRRRRSLRDRSPACPTAPAPRGAPRLAGGDISCPPRRGNEALVDLCGVPFSRGKEGAPRRSAGRSFYLVAPVPPTVGPEPWPLAPHPPTPSPRPPHHVRGGQPHRRCPGGRR